jgi:hypothetical protein
VAFNCGFVSNSEVKMISEPTVIIIIYNSKASMFVCCIMVYESRNAIIPYEVSISMYHLSEKEIIRKFLEVRHVDHDHTQLVGNRT